MSPVSPTTRAVSTTPLGVHVCSSCPCTTVTIVYYVSGERSMLFTGLDYTLHMSFLDWLATVDSRQFTHVSSSYNYAMVSSNNSR